MLVAVATTKAFSAQLTVIYALCIRLAYSAGKISKPRYGELIEEIKLLPDKISQILGQENKFKEISDIFDDVKYTCFQRTSSL